MTTSSGSIMSPNYPNMYDNTDDCAWLIEVDLNHVVSFTYEDFDVEPHSNCRFGVVARHLFSLLPSSSSSYDYVALYDGANTSAPLIAQSCGPTLPSPNTFVSTGNQMYVRFKADGSVPAKGFKANYTWV